MGNELHLDYVTFDGRSERIAYLAKAFDRRLQTGARVLDVGCDMRPLKTLRPDLEYVGVDIGGEPDIQVDLESVERLPFEDGQFDVVICSDVLEHLDNLHFIFAELVRVSRRHVIISLPNCWNSARQRIERGYGSFSHYGLPAERPADRHKWFFSLSEACVFAEACAKKHAISIDEMRVNEKIRPAFVRWLRRMRYFRRERYWNRYAHTLWIIFEKGTDVSTKSLQQA